MTVRDMTLRAEQLVGQKRFAIAGVIAGAVCAVIIVQDVLGSFLSQLIALPNNGYSAETWGAVVVRDLVIVLPFGIGVLLSLWLIASIPAHLRILPVIGRCVLAAVAGAVLTAIVAIVLGVLGAVGFSGAIFANSFPSASFSRSQAFFALTGGIGLGVRYFLQSAPVVILAGVLAWIWLGRQAQEYGSNVGTNGARK